jgi:hypothetical protein
MLQSYEALITSALCYYIDSYFGRYCQYEGHLISGESFFAILPALLLAFFAISANFSKVREDIFVGIYKFILLYMVYVDKLKIAFLSTRVT